MGHRLERAQEINDFPADLPGFHQGRSIDCQRREAPWQVDVLRSPTFCDPVGSERELLPHADGANRVGVFKGIGGKLNANGDVSVGQVNYELEEVAVADQNELHATTIQVAALPRKGEQRWIDQNLFVAVRLRRRGSGDFGPLTRHKALSPVKRRIANGRGDSEDLIDDAFGVLHGTSLSWPGGCPARLTKPC